MRAKGGEHFSDRGKQLQYKCCLYSIRLEAISISRPTFFFWYALHYSQTGMARPIRTRRAAAPDSAARDGPAPSTLRKRSHADALGRDTTSALPAAAGAAEASPRRSKRGKTGKEADANDEADSVPAAAPHDAAAVSRLDPCPSSSTLATSSDLGIEIAITERPDVDRPLGDDSDAVAAEDDEMTAQERRALKGKAKATDEDEDEDQVMAENVAASEDAVQKQLRELNEVSSPLKFPQNRTRPAYNLGAAARRLSDCHSRVTPFSRDLQRLPRTTRTTFRAPVRSRLVRFPGSLSRARALLCSFCPCPLTHTFTFLTGIAAVETAWSTGSSDRRQTVKKKMGREKAAEEETPLLPALATSQATPPMQATLALAQLEQRSRTRRLQPPRRRRAKPPKRSRGDNESKPTCGAISRVPRLLHQPTLLGPRRRGQRGAESPRRRSLQRKKRN